MKIIMDETLKPNQNKDLLDSIYNHKPICEVLLKDGYEEASKLFCEKAIQLKNAPESDESMLRCICLNSLNKCLYNFILFAWDISLAECCFKNLSYSHTYEDHNSFVIAGNEILQSYACQICSNKAKNSYIEQALTYIDHHISEKLTLDIVSKNIFVSKSYLAQTFKSSTGQNFSDYISTRRTNIAKNLLITTDLKIDEIAIQCGFFSSTYFSTVFKRNTNLSPNDFRKKYSKSNIQR